VIEFLEVNWLLMTALAVVLAALFLLLRNRVTKIGSTEEIWKRGEPVIVEVLSNV
jgi:hypothetical protein